MPRARHRERSTSFHAANRVSAYRNVGVVDPRAPPRSEEVTFDTVDLWTHLCFVRTV